MQNNKSCGLIYCFGGFDLLFWRTYNLHNLLFWRIRSALRVPACICLLRATPANALLPIILHSAARVLLLQR